MQMLRNNIQPTCLSQCMALVDVLEVEVAEQEWESNQELLFFSQTSKLLHLTFLNIWKKFEQLLDILSAMIQGAAWKKHCIHRSAISKVSAISVQESPKYDFPPLHNDTADYAFVDISQDTTNYAVGEKSLSIQKQTPLFKLPRSRHPGSSRSKAAIPQFTREHITSVSNWSILIFFFLAFASRYCRACRYC